MNITILSVNLAQLEPIPGAKKKTLTGIFKRPVQGLVQVLPSGLVGDHIGSVKYHGGPDQAVYLYSREDYLWWEKELGRPLEPGIFGENLTLSRFGAEPPRIGDRWQMGQLLLEISGPRIPCVTLAQRMQDPTFVKRFARANRGGCYARVLEPGSVQAGMEVEILSARSDHPFVSDVFALCHSRDKDPDLLARALASPLAERCRADLRKVKEKGKLL